MTRSSGSPPFGQGDSSEHNTSQQPIPLQNLSPHSESTQYAQVVSPEMGGSNIAQDSDRLSPTSAQLRANLPGIRTYWDQSQSQSRSQPARERSPDSPFDPAALQFALPPDIHPPPEPPGTGSGLGHYSNLAVPSNPYAMQTPDYDEPSQDYLESDRAPLTSGAQPISGSLIAPPADLPSRSSFQTVSDLGDGPPRSPRGRDTRMLGYDLETGYDAGSPGRSRGRGTSLKPWDGRTSHSPGSALSRAGSIVRAMSQRVVNIGGEAEALEQHQKRARSRSRSPSIDSRRPSQSPVSPVDTSYQSQLYSNYPQEKRGDMRFTYSQEAPLPPLPSLRLMPNPLKGKSLGIFGPEAWLRRRLCDLLVNPYMEPIILILIVIQAILLAIEAAPNVFDPGQARPESWVGTAIDKAMLGLFIIFTLELIARIIVSGFVLNASEYSTIDRSRGVRVAMAEQYSAVFRPQRQKSVKGVRPETYGPSTFARSLTVMQGQRVPETVEEAQRMQLARRAFLRHGFNRLDFLAVMSFWISFLMSITGAEARHHFYLFRMLSCLRIVRLLALTNGTSIILRSLKKATPLLLRVSFLVSFFWVLFAIIGIQSFKNSLSRHCVWLDPTDPTDITKTYTVDMSFCGGYIDAQTNNTMPWVKSEDGGLTDLVNGAQSPKGIICPRGSLCLQQDSPYNSTVNFDNIFHSLELVFVIMSANTWSDLMYYTTYSDYLPTALFFGAGIMIMMLWMTNLLIAVITSSFQVIREESKSSAFTAANQDDAQPLDQEPEHQIPRVSTLQKRFDRTWLFWVALISADIIAQAFRSSENTPSDLDWINTIEIVVTCLLDLEIIIRITANWRGFHRSWRNLFDLFLAVVTTVILLPPIFRSGQPYAWLTGFQILRVYRVVLAIPMTRKLILLVLGNAAGIANLMMFVFLITFLMAILASQLFRGELPMYDDSGELVEISFYNIYNSFLGMYQVLSSENWTSLLYNVTSYTKIRSTSWYGAAFMIGWFTLAFFILVNMFIAVIQENFDVSEDEKRLEQVKAFLQRKELGSNSSHLALSTIFSFGKKRKVRDPLDYGPATMEMLLKDAVVREFLDDNIGDPLQQTNSAEESPTQGNGTGHGRPGPTARVWGWAWGKVRSRFISDEPNPFYSNLRFNGVNDTHDPREMARQVMNASSSRRKAQRDYLARHPKYNNALYILTPQNPLRRFCQRLVGPGRGSERIDGVEPNKIAWYALSAFIYAAIVAMVVLACVTTPLYQKVYFMTHDYAKSNWFIWLDLGFAILFTVEAVIKVIADGFLLTPNAYFRSSWGAIDGIVLVTLWINIFAFYANDGAVSRAVGAFKALRALRLLNVSDTARDTFHSLIIVGGWNIMSAALVSLSLLVPFAVYALNLFNGRMISCNDDSVSSLNDCFAEYQATPFSENWPILAPRVAANPYYDFDDFASSLFTLFQIVSQEGWVDVSFSAQAITGVGQQPEPGMTPGNAVFFVVYNLLGTVFILTLFISVFMRNYTEQTGVAFLTSEQRAWLELRKLLRQVSPSKTSYDDSEKTWKKWCHKRAIEKRGKWYTVVTVVLVLHLILMMTEYATEPSWWSTTRDAILLLFTLIYIANITIRIVGLGWSRFRKSSWDMYALVTVVGAFLSSIMLISNTGLQAYVQLHKFFLVSILLLLIPRNDALDQLFKTAAASLTTIINLLATWLVFFLVFAIALTQTFSLTRFADNEEYNINFRTVPNALILLFRMSAGEGWNQIMEDFAGVEPPFCTENNNFLLSDCGSAAWARFLFIAWNIVSMFIFVNLFISLIYESFSFVYQRSSGLATVDRDELRRFKEAWRSVDPAGTGFINKEAFPRLLGELSGVFEMRIYEAEDSIRNILEDVRGEAPNRHNSIVSVNNLNGLDIRKLDERLNKIDVQKVRVQRRRFRIFYEEVLVSADPDRGISFTSVLMILAHYNIISDSKSLRLEEFLRRRARLQRVEEQVRRRTVLNFFDTLYWARKFKKHVEKKRSARIASVPQLDLPDIYVQQDGQSTGESHLQASSDTASRSRGASSSSFLTVSDNRISQHSGGGRYSSGEGSPAYHQQNFSSSNNNNNNSNNNSSSPPHPLSLPRDIQGQHPHGSTAYSFEIQDPGPASGENSARASSINPSQVRDFLEDSVWVESIRRSATVRKSVRKSAWNAHE